jgi:hypothetical protein
MKDITSVQLPLLLLCANLRAKTCGDNSQSFYYSRFNDFILVYFITGNRAAQIQFAAASSDTIFPSAAPVHFGINDVRPSICKKNHQFATLSSFSQKTHTHSRQAERYGADSKLIRVCDAEITTQSRRRAKGDLFWLWLLSLMFCPTKSDSVIGFHCSYGNRHREHLTCHVNFFPAPLFSDDALSHSMYVFVWMGGCCCRRVSFSLDVLPLNGTLRSRAQ